MVGKDTHDSHALYPAVVRTKSQEKAATASSEHIGEILGTRHDVVTLGTS